MFAVFVKPNTSEQATVVLTSQSTEVADRANDDSLLFRDDRVDTITFSERLNDFVTLK